MNKKNFLSQWLPAIIIAGLGAVFTIVYTVTEENRLLTVYLQLIACMAGIFIFPLWGIITKKPFVPALCVIAGILMTGGIYLGKAANFYGRVPDFDKILHTNFGVMGAAIVYALIARWGGDGLKPVGKILIILLATLGLGVLWEFMEFYGAILSGEDPQRVWFAVDKIIEAGGEHVVNPVDDTMQDLLVTFIGCSVFLVFYIIDDLFGGKVCKALFCPQKDTKTLR